MNEKTNCKFENTIEKLPEQRIEISIGKLNIGGVLICD